MRVKPMSHTDQVGRKGILRDGDFEGRLRDGSYVMPSPAATLRRVASSFATIQQAMELSKFR